MGPPTIEDHKLYVELVNRCRIADGLATLPTMLSVEDPRPFNTEMLARLGEA